MINFSDSIIQYLCQQLKLNESSEFELNFFGEVLSIEAAITPRILGEITNFNITFYIDEILKYFFPAMS